jgi:hypothetical protein
MSGQIETFPDRRPARRTVWFSRAEFDTLLALYGRLVAGGVCRDYALADTPDAAVFAMFRRTSEQPLYAVEKRPALAQRQGAWVVIGQGGRILKRGRDLQQVLSVIERALLRLVEAD